jgi:hypothetical protein
MPAGEQILGQLLEKRKEQRRCLSNSNSSHSEKE